MSKKFNHLNFPDQWNHYWSRYPQGYTILESLISWVSQVDDMVDSHNLTQEQVATHYTNTTNLINTFQTETRGDLGAFGNRLDAFILQFDASLQNKVVNTLTAWQLSGFLDVVIDAALQTEMDNLVTTTEQTLVTFSEQLAEVASNVLYVESFRQTGEQDDTALIQRAFTYIENNPGKRELKFASNKEYIISSPLVFNKHKYTTMTGAGTVIKVSDSVSELSPITHMIDCCYLGTGNLSGYLVCKDIEFDTNNRALKTINGINPEDAFGYGLYYSKFINTKFSGLRRDSWGIYGLSWSVSISDCIFLGYGEDPLNNTEHWRGKALFLANASNGVSVKGCNFARLERVAEGNADRVTFSDNVFDHIKKAPFKVNGTSLSIEKNYFEATGGEVENVNVYGKESEVVDAIIIFTNDSSDWTGIGRGLTVEENTFTNVKASNVLALNHVVNVKFAENTFNFTEPFNSLAYIFGNGLQYSGRRNGYGLLSEFNNIEQWSTTYPNGRKIANKIVDFSSLGNEINKGLEGIQIKDSLTFENQQQALPVNLYSGDFVSHSAELPDWLITKQTISDEVVYKFELQSHSYVNKISLDKYLKKSKGSYLRIKFSTVNTQSGAPIRFSLVDGVNNITYIPDGTLTDPNTEWTPYESLVYVDKNATELSFTISSYCSIGQSVYLKDFIISPAHYDCGMYADIEA